MAIDTPSQRPPSARRLPAFDEIEWPALRWVSADDRATLQKMLRPLRVSGGELIQKRGDPITQLTFFGSGYALMREQRSNGLISAPRVVGRGDVFGESAFGGDGDTAVATLQAQGEVRGWTLPITNRMRALTEELPSLARAMHTIHLLRMHAPRMARALQRTHTLATASINALIQLVLVGELVSSPADETIYSAGEPVKGVYILVEGAVLEGFPALALADQVGDVRSEGRLIRAGQPMGSLLNGMAEEQATAKTLEPTTHIFWSVDVIEAQMRDSPSLRRAIQGADAFAQKGLRGPTVIHLSVEAPYSGAGLAHLLAASLFTDFGDVCVCAALEPESQPAVAPSRREGVTHRQVRYGPANLAAMVTALRDALPTADYLITYLGVGGQTSDAGDLVGVVGRVARLSRDTFTDPPVQWRADQVRWAVPLPEAAVSKGELAYQHGTVRLNLTRQALSTPPAHAALSAKDRGRYSRWARSLSDRTVGVALGGGGAWGYAHLPLLALLAKLDIPVDMVSGASFGAVCASYYTALPADAWYDALVKDGARFTRATQLGFWSSRFIGRAIDAGLARYGAPVTQLEMLEVPFLPVATDVGAGREAVITKGPVAVGVRASSSFPGIITPTILDGARYVDGGIVRNVPVDPLGWNGADLIIASNIVPNPPHDAPEQSRATRLGRIAQEFNLFRRTRDTLRSVLILMHSTGESQAWEANVVYNAPAVGVPPNDLSKGQAVIDGTQAAADAMRDEIERAWEQLKSGSL